MKKRIVETVGVFLLLIGLLGLGSSCGEGDPPTAPDPVNGVFTTATFPYLCNDGSPAFLVENGPNGGGNLIVDVTGNTVPEFKDRNVNTLINNTIDCGSMPTCCISHTFPETGAYTVTLWYVEFGDQVCLPPPSGGCWRWFKQQSFTSGFKPSCSNSITINIMDPTGFAGSCM